MARKKKEQDDFDTNIPENDELPEEEMEEIAEEEEEDLGVDEIFGSTNPGSAHRDLDVWGSEEYDG